MTSFQPCSRAPAGGGFVRHHFERFFENQGENRCRTVEARRQHRTGHTFWMASGTRLPVRRQVGSATIVI